MDARHQPPEEVLKFLQGLAEAEAQQKTGEEGDTPTLTAAPPAQEFAQSAREEALVQLRERSKDDSFRIRNLEARAARRCNCPSARHLACHCVWGCCGCGAIRAIEIWQRPVGVRGQ